MNKSPISYLDYLYIELENKINANSNVQVLLKEIQQEQHEKIKIALLATKSTTQLVVLGQSELEALRLLGHYSLYLYTAQGITIGSGLTSYYADIIWFYTLQNKVLESRDYEKLLNSWEIVRGTLIQRGLSAPTQPPDNRYNNNCITLIDELVQKLRVNSIEAKLLMPVIIEAIKVAQSFKNSGIEIRDSFYPVLQDNIKEQEKLASIGIVSDVLVSVATAIPDQKVADFYFTIGSLYDELLKETDPQLFINLYYTYRPKFISASLYPL